MLTEEQKDKLIESLVKCKYDRDIIIPNPVILMDRDDNHNPWITDESYARAFSTEITRQGSWEVNSDEFDVNEVFSHSTNAYGLPEKNYDKAFKVTREDDPDFIEKVKLVLQFRRL